MATEYARIIMVTPIKYYFEINMLKKDFPTIHSSRPRTAASAEFRVRSSGIKTRRGSTDAWELYRILQKTDKGR